MASISKTPLDSVQYMCVSYSYTTGPVPSCGSMVVQGRHDDRRPGCGGRMAAPRANFCCARRLRAASGRLTCHSITSKLMLVVSLPVLVRSTLTRGGAAIPRHHHYTANSFISVVAHWPSSWLMAASGGESQAWAAASPTSGTRRRARFDASDDLCIVQAVHRYEPFAAGHGSKVRVWEQVARDTQQHAGSRNLRISSRAVSDRYQIHFDGEVSSAVEAGLLTSLIL